MPKEESSVYFTRQLDKSRNPNKDFPPFVTKTKKNDVVYPIYTPYDATDTVQGSVWLTDDVDDDGGSAEKGMTAVTPKGVGDFTKKHSFYLVTEESVANGGLDNASPSNLVEGFSSCVKAFSEKSVAGYWGITADGAPPVVFTPDAPEFSFKNQVYFGQKIADDLASNDNRPVFYGGLTLFPAPTISVTAGRDENGESIFEEASFSGHENADITLPYITDDEILALFNGTIGNDTITTVVFSGTEAPPSKGTPGSVYIKY